MATPGRVGVRSPWGNSPTSGGGGYSTPSIPDKYKDAIRRRQQREVPDIDPPAQPLPDRSLNSGDKRETTPPDVIRTPPGQPTPKRRNQSPVPSDRYESDTSSETAPEQPEDNFGHDPIFEEGMNQIKEQLAQMKADQLEQQRRLEEQQAAAQEQMVRWRDDSLESNTERMADQGLVHSGINIGEQADIGEEFIRNNEELNQMSADTRAGLERSFAQQRQQLQGMENQLRQERAAREAAEQKEQDLTDAIADTPEPTVTGRYDLSDILVSNEAKKNVAQDRTGADNKFMESPELIGERVEAIFGNNEVPLTSRNETDAQRLERLVREIASGQRTFNDVRESVDRIAGASNIGAHSGTQLYPSLMDNQDISGNDRYYMQSPQLMAERVGEMFGNRGVDIATENETELERLNRIIQEIGLGQRSFNDVRTSLDRIAANQ